MKELWARKSSALSLNMESLQRYLFRKSHSQIFKHKKPQQFFLSMKDFIGLLTRYSPYTCMTEIKKQVRKTKKTLNLKSITAIYQIRERKMFHS